MHAEQKQAANGQQSRSLVTQIALMEAAEKLMAERGAHQVSIKEIVAEAGQKNPSALQYHFKNLQGLVEAIHDRRSEQTRTKRAQMLTERQSQTGELELRDLCELMFVPSFLLAKSDVNYRQYVKAFSFDIATASDSALQQANKVGGGGGAQLAALLRKNLKHLDDKAYLARMELAVRTCSSAIGSYFRQKSPVKGPQADFFVSNVIDALEGLLSAPTSKQTKSAGKQL